MDKLKELDKLEKYLQEHNIAYQRIDERGNMVCVDVKNIAPLDAINAYLTRHQIIVPSKQNREWDVICHPGSYGYKEGLLELMGNISRNDDVEGYLTAEDVIERIKENEKG